MAEAIGFTGQPIIYSSSIEQFLNISYIYLKNIISI